MSEETLIGELEKNAADVIRIQLLKLTVGLYVDVRVWSTARPGDGPGLHRTERGFMIAVEQLPELERILKRAREMAEAEKAAEARGERG